MDRRVSRPRPQPTTPLHRSRRAPWLLTAASALAIILLAAPQSLAQHHRGVHRSGGSRISFGVHHRSGHHGGHSGIHIGLHSGRHVSGHHRSHHGTVHHRSLIHHRSYVYSRPYIYHSPIVYTYPRYVSYGYTAPYYSSLTYSYRPNTAYVVRPATTVYQSNNFYTPSPANSEYGYDAKTPTPPAEPDGWAKLSDSMYDASTALNTFAAEAERHPNAALPKVGYALSQGLLQNDEKAAWAMRRAVHTDVESLRQVPLNDPIRGKVRELADRYDQRAREGFSRTDDLFMIASLRVIEGQFAAAHSAITAAERGGDRDETTATLKRYIDGFYTPQTEPQP